MHLPNSKLFYKFTCFKMLYGIERDKGCVIVFLFISLFTTEYFNHATYHINEKTKTLYWLSKICYFFLHFFLGFSAWKVSLNWIFSLSKSTLEVSGNNNRNFGTLAFFIIIRFSNVILLLFTEVEASNWKWGQEVVQELGGARRAREKSLL